MRRKGICGISLMLACLLCLTGCNLEGQWQESSESISEQENISQQENIMENTTESETTMEQVTEPEEVDVDWGTAPLLLAAEWKDNRYSESGVLLVEGTFESLEISGEGYEAVAESVKEWFRQREESFTQTMDLYEEYALDAQENSPAFFGYSNIVSCTATRADSSVISLKCGFSDYIGGAHGNRVSMGVTFDSQTGEKISFWDLTDQKEEFARRTLEYCLEQIAEEYEDMLFADYEDTIRKAWELEPNWYLNGTGIVIEFSAYEVGPYAMGKASVVLQYEDFSDLLRPEYQMGGRAGVAILEKGIPAQISLGKATGEKETVRLYVEGQEDEYAYTVGDMLLEVGGETEVVSALEWLEKIYLIQREDGRSFVLFDGDMASDDYVTYVYEITDGQIRKTYESTHCASICGDTVTTQGLKLAVRAEALGTYTAYGDYRMTEDGALEPLGEWFSVNTPYEFEGLTTIRELPVAVDGEPAILPVGSRLKLTATNRNGILRYELMGSMEEGEIHYTTGENGWPVYIDGVEDTEYFESLPYAG